MSSKPAHTKAKRHPHPSHADAATRAAPSRRGDGDVSFFESLAKGRYTPSDFVFATNSGARIQRDDRVDMQGVEFRTRALARLYRSPPRTRKRASPPRAKPPEPDGAAESKELSEKYAGAFAVSLPAHFGESGDSEGDEAMHALGAKMEGAAPFADTAPSLSRATSDEDVLALREGAAASAEPFDSEPVDGAVPADAAEMSGGDLSGYGGSAELSMSAEFSKSALGGVGGEGSFYGDEEMPAVREQGDPSAPPQRAPQLQLPRQLVKKVKKVPPPPRPSRYDAASVYGAPLAKKNSAGASELRRMINEPKRFAAVKKMEMESQRLALDDESAPKDSIFTSLSLALKHRRRVERLDLSALSLREVPPEVGALPNLREVGFFFFEGGIFVEYLFGGNMRDIFVSAYRRM
jgi:hypothetical protein